MMTIMRNSTKQRADQKQDSLERILDAGARRVRVEGLDRAAIVPVMQDAGLTHGAFYSHFSSKDDLTVAAFVHAITEGRPRWTKTSGEATWGERLKRLAKRYLSPSHRDNLQGSCAFAALSTDAARANPRFREAYEEELRRTLAAICEPFKQDGATAQRKDEAIALMALCVGGISLSRAVDDDAFSTRILRACQDGVAAIADAADTTQTMKRGRK
jgi:TetR/AcrR family transcriptional regulator, transcriptional repressor for nem operon